MKNARIDIASIRREQVVEAAVAVITERGLQNLSLSEIEKKAGMSRGQLTYYFPTKEDILLAVFDRLVQLMCRRSHPSDPPCDPANWWSRLQELLPQILNEPAVHPEFHSLQYTFLSQINHRADFRERLATLYEEIRGHMAEGIAGELRRRRGRRTASPRALSTLVQAILHGLVMQAAADPNAFDRQEMVSLVLDVLDTYLGAAAPARSRPRRPAELAATVGDAPGSKP